MAKTKARANKSTAKLKAKAKPKPKARAQKPAPKTKAKPSKAASSKAASSKAVSNKGSSAMAPAVRDVVARVAAIDWNGISGEQATGFATQFAVLAAGGKPAAKAFATIRRLLGDDGRTMPIAGLAFPFLTELLSHVPVADHAVILEYLTNAAMFGHAQWIESGFMPPDRDGGLLSARSRARIHAAFSAGAPLYRTLLGHGDAKVRAASAFALGFARSGDITMTTTALREALATEGNAGVRASLLLAIAMTDRGSVAASAAPSLTASSAEERLAAAIASSLGQSPDPRVVAVLGADAAVRLTSPWFSGDAAAFARRRVLVATFGAPPDERPGTAPVLTAAQLDALREMLGAATPPDVAAFATALGLPEKDAALRRFAGIPRAIPTGAHAAIYDRWMTWAETGVPETMGLARELAGEIPAAGFVAIIEAMGFAESDHDEELAEFAIPLAPGLAPPPADADDYNAPGTIYRYHAGTVDDLVRAYEQLVRAAGYATWSHGHDGDNDLNQGDVNAWHPDGREIRACFDARNGLVRARYESNRSLLRPFSAAMVDRHGAEPVLASLRTQAGAGVRLALVLLRAGWAIADHLRIAPDPVCDDFALTGGGRRHYIYGPPRSHIERLSGERRTHMVLRFLAADTDSVFGWARFADTPEVRFAATKMLHRQFTSSSTSYYDLDGAERAAERMAPWVDDPLRKVLRKHVKADDNPVVQVLLLARDGDWDAIRPALESEYPMAREAARKVLAAAPKP